MKGGWKEMDLGEVLQLEYGKPLPESDRKPGGHYPVYGANGGKGRTDRFYYDKPSIIVGRKGSAGEINLTEGKFWPLEAARMDMTVWDWSAVIDPIGISSSARGPLVWS